MATLWDVGTIVGVTKFPAQNTHLNRAWSGSFTAYPSAVDSDYLMIDYGFQHVGPTSGGTGAGVTFGGTSADLPVGDTSTSSGRSWVELCG